MSCILKSIHPSLATLALTHGFKVLLATLALTHGFKVQNWFQNSGHHMAELRPDAVITGSCVFAVYSLQPPEGGRPVSRYLCPRLNGPAQGDSLLC